MTVKPKPKKKYTGPDRRAPKPPPSPGRSLFGGSMIIAGFVAWVLFHHEAGEIIPILMIGFGGYLVDRDGVRSVTRLLPFRNGQTAEHKAPRG